ncbi:unnamed protein product [Adineta steineri]|uniref:Uncharacterized protein n=1 Tax=Adineta steineri TaxID=433720 RepID=A0A818JLW8_9BILA|nr:unnamed protein product [Adineta steineri]CAF3544295.1 unnamed protein product [Adineta steineri]
MNKIIPIWICIVWLLNTVMTETVDIDLQEGLILNITQKSLFMRNLTEGKGGDHLLTEQWQDYVLANAMLTNYLNILLVHASKTDFSLGNGSNQCTLYIQSLNSFRHTIIQLADNIRHHLTDLCIDMHRIHRSLENVPIHLKTILVLIKKGSKTLINTKLSDLLKKNENIVNGYLKILRNSKIKFEEIKNLLAELNSLISMLTINNVITLQIEDITIQWNFLTDLFTHLAVQAETSSNYFLLQFNWILEQFIQFDIDTNRDLIINLLLSKVIEIERILDLLAIISETYVDISLQYSNEKLIDNANLLLISNEQERKDSIRQHRYELQPQTVKFARLALTRHDEFLQRNQNRQIIYEKFLNESSQSDLNILLNMN